MRKSIKAGSGGMVRQCKKIFMSVLWGGLMFGFILSSHITVKAASVTNLSDEIPKNIKQYCEEIGQQYDICPELLEAIAWHESRFIPEVTNKNCHGLCQINIKVHKDRIEKLGYTSGDMLEPYPNIHVAADLLAELYATYGDDNPIVLSLYAGEGWKAVEKYKDYGFMTPIVSDILSKSAEYERLHGK